MAASLGLQFIWTYKMLIFMLIFIFIIKDVNIYVNIYTLKKWFWASLDFRKLTHLILWMSEKC